MKTVFTSHIDPATITKVYSGKPGCGCGCKGKYFTDARNITRVVDFINAAAATGAVKVHDGASGDTIYAFETANRYFWAYTAEAA